MKGLLKADFRRVLKDKLLLVMGILAVGFAVIMTLLYAAIFAGTSPEESDMATAMLSGTFSGKAQFFTALSIGDNLGLIAPVLLGIALCKDFSFGTVRNKIIAGKSRSSIFLSLFITCSVVFVGVMLLHAFISLGLSLIFFDYQPTPFTMADFWLFLESLGFSILTLLFASAMLSWLCASMKNVGLVIVLYIAIIFILALASGILQIVISVMEITGGNEQTLSVLQVINRLNVCNSATYIGSYTQYTREDVLYLTIPPVVGILGFVGLGLSKFNRKDLK